jgi:hypothetical protein
LLQLLLLLLPGLGTKSTKCAVISDTVDRGDCHTVCCCLLQLLLLLPLLMLLLLLGLGTHPLA